MTPLELRHYIELDLPLSDEMLKELLYLYATPTRYYHNIHHVIEVLGHYQSTSKKNGWTNSKEVYLAVLYHDAIYEYGAKDNEKRSALIAKDAIAKHFSSHQIDSEYVQKLIELTAIHGKLRPDDVSEEEALFLDCDMAIVGSSWERFSQYQDAIEKEYCTVYPKLLYRIGRKKFLKSVLSAERIFLSSVFHQQYNLQARSNLKQALG